MTDALSPLLDGLLASTSFEDVAELALRAMLSGAEEALTGGGGRGRLLRGLVHLRPDGGYRALAVLERGAERLAVPDGDAMRPSMSVSQLVEARRVPLAVDVRLAEATPLGGAPLLVRGLEAPGEGGVEGSRARFLRRDATHLLVLPLRFGAGQAAGMISLEANCPAAAGAAGLWDACAADLQRLADLTTPYLLARPPRPGPQPLRTGDPLLPVVGPAMEGLIGLLRVFAQHDETILLMGATGTGKTRLGRWCHACSSRRDGPFEIVDLNTVPREMQPGELFGWRKGAFTGAVSDHAGRVSQAEGGTILLDEIDKLSLDAQAALLQLLEERRYRALGDPAGWRRADVRFLVGTNADLQAAVREGRFRADLYYRINVLPVHLPPLRERAEEILPWAEFMLARRHREGGAAGAVRLSGDAGAVLSAFPWPGNLRQLDNVIRRAYAMALIDGAAGGGGAAVEIARRHVERALRFERDRETGLLDLLREAARAYAAEAERRRERGAPLPLDLAESFPGMVLSAACTLTGGKKEAYQLFGQDHVVEARNHHKAFERALSRVQAALHALGEPPEPEVEAQLSD